MAMTITIIEASCSKHQEKPTLLIILRMKKQKFHRFLFLRFRLTSKHEPFVKIQTPFALTIVHLMRLRTVREQRKQMLTACMVKCRSGPGSRTRTSYTVSKC